MCDTISTFKCGYVTQSLNVRISLRIFWCPMYIPTPYVQSDILYIFGHQYIQTWVCVTSFECAYVLHVHMCYTLASPNICCTHTNCYARQFQAADTLANACCTCLLQCLSACCSVLHVWIVVCCSVFQRVAVCYTGACVCATDEYWLYCIVLSHHSDADPLQHNAAHCNMLQHAATRRSTLQHTATSHTNAPC